MAKQNKYLDLTTELWNEIINTGTGNINTNYVGQNIKLVTDFQMYRKNMPLQQMFKIHYPHIVLITEGKSTCIFNYHTYTLKKGTLVYMPQGTLFCIMKRTENYNFLAVEYNIPQTIQQTLFVFHLNILELSPTDYQRTEKYFSLLHDCLKSPKQLDLSTEHLIVALLSDIGSCIATENKDYKNHTHAEILFHQFMQLLMQDWDSFPRNVKFYAKQLFHNDNYLSTIVKQVSGYSACLN